MSDVKIRVSGLAKTFRVYPRPHDRLFEMLWGGIRHTSFEAVKPLSFEVRAGEILGIVGHNGSGKSTLLQMICGTLPATSGSVDATGRISALLELGAGFNPEFTGRENVLLNATILGFSKSQIKKTFDTIAEFAGIGEHMEQAVKTYSSGMYVRLAFAVAVAVRPDILVVDEALSVGDIAFQRKCISRIREMQKEGTTVLFVSHSASTVMELCDRVILLHEGEMLAEGIPPQLMPWYQKLMFAPKPKRAGIAAAIRSGKEWTEDGDVGEGRKKAYTKETYDPSMVPESRVTYEENGARIINPHLTTLKGKKVNILRNGERYLYRFQVKFLQDAERIRAAFHIKTTNGMELGGASTSTEKRAVLAAKKGEVLDIGFTFTCHLLQGTYFMNAGCSAIRNAERVTLHRIMDAAMFMVLPNGGEYSTGKVDFAAIPKISRSKTVKKK